MKTTPGATLEAMPAPVGQPAIAPPQSGPAPMMPPSPKIAMKPKKKKIKVTDLSSMKAAAADRLKEMK